MVLVSGTKKNVFRPIIEKIAIFKKKCCANEECPCLMTDFTHVDETLTKCSYRLSKYFSKEKHLKKCFYKCHKLKIQDFFSSILGNSTYIQLPEKEPISSFSERLWVNLRYCPWI